MMTYPQADFARSTPEAQGIASAAIEKMLRDIQKTGSDVHSLLIARHGHLVFEQYFAPYTAETRHSMYSCSKTFTSMLIGAAQDRGLLSVKDHVLDFFPETEIAEVSDNLRAMTVEDLLMMGSGHGADTFGPMIESATDPEADWVKIFLNRPVDHRPGTHFVYNTGATYMLSAILTKVTGRTALQLAEEWLFADLGIEGARWEACPKGVSMGGTGLHVTPRDMMKLGLLMLCRGRWKNKQLISQEWIQAAQTKHIENRSGDPNQDHNWAAGYCYQIWRCVFGAYRADGMGGQYIVVLPREEMVVVITSAMGADTPMGILLDMIENDLLPGVHRLPQVYGVEAAESLKKLSEELAAPRAGGVPEAAKGFPFGKRIVFEENALGLTEMTVCEDSVCMKLAGQTLRTGFGWGAPVIGEEKMIVPHRWMREDDVCARAEWRDGLYLVVNYVGEPLTLKIHVKAENGKAAADVKCTLLPSARMNGAVAE